MAGTRGGKASQPRTPAATKSKKRSAPEISPTNGDGEPKKKRGRPSKADIAAREARQSQASENGNGANGADDKMEGVIAEATKNGDAMVTPPATKKKRGRPSKADKEKSQLSSEESTDEVDNSGEKSGEKPAQESNGHTDDSGVKKSREHTNGTNGVNGSSSSDGPSQDTMAENQLSTEKNAFDMVKSGLGEEAPKLAENEKEPEAISDSKDVSAAQAATSDASKETTDLVEKNDTPVVDIGDDISVKDFARQEEIPSSILEKGIIYFFFRSRVNVSEPQGIEDVARSYIVLRPLPIGAKITSETLSDDGNARLLALPKKKLPQSGKDKFLVFVEKKGATVKDLREQFSGNEYATQTSGYVIPKHHYETNRN